MGAASKYLLRQPSAAPAEPKRLSEIDALGILNAATERASCGLCEVGPLVAHLVGPVAAAPPEGHPDWFKLRAPGDPLRRPSALAEQLTRTCGATGTSGLVACTCDGRSRHPLAVIMRHISRARIIRVHHNSQVTQRRLDAAFQSGDIDRLTYEFEPRVECLKILVDRARAANGGGLPDLVIEAAALLARTLVGPTRWDVRRGWDMVDWEPGWRVGAAFETAQSVLVQDFIADRVMIRLLEGR